MTDLKGKTAIITGGSRGIGAGIAEKFAAYGANVAIIYNGNLEKATEVKQKVESFGTKCEIYKCNVASSEECKQTVKNIVADFGGFEILVNNAGITKDNLLVMMEDEEFDAVIDTNLKGCFNMIKACSRNFIKKKYGKIINISSVSGIMGLAGQANYSASKAGVIALTKVTARELGGKNVCCNAIAPGFITTDMTKDLDSSEEFLKSIPKARLGTPEDVANLAAFLASSMSDYITGETVRVDGGLAI
ncbi:MAG: 3-oxoacyl-[acyl-carrier-protein] reductase [Ruminococcaceae bacterium]|nr:3-oxoacyl-[acyl-carrier-protein] reductase [Oscillospiraceae bacterium]